MINIADSLSCGKVTLNPHLTTTQYHTQRHDYATKVIVVGCGGTGGRTIPLIAQHIANHNLYIRTSNAYRDKAYLKHEIGLIFIDNDTVELKNTLRQNFFHFDIGKPKAQIFAERIGALYGLDIEYYVCKYGDVPIFQAKCANAIVFDHTDNKAARESIEKNLIGQNNVIISTGNKDTFGQVFISYVKSGNRTGEYYNTISSLRNIIAAAKPTSKASIPFFPTFLETFRDFKDTEAPPCTEMVLQNEQSMPVNNLVATCAYNVFYDLMSGVNFNYYMVKCNINNTFSTSYLTNPKTYLNLCYKVFFGVDTPDISEEKFTILSKTFTKADYSLRDSLAKQAEFIAELRSHDIYSIPFIANLLVSKGYYFDNNFINELNNLSAELGLLLLERLESK